MRRSLVASVTLSLTLVVATGCVIVDPSCGGGGATILVTPSTVVVAVGQTTTPKARWCRDGHYDDLSPHWSLADEASADIISIDPVTGRITGKRAGTATVIATYAGAGGTAVRVTVQ
jgi:uncharacterized protein YjdB